MKNPKLISFILISALLLASLLPAAAFADGDTVYISTAEELTEFSKNCALDAYSEGRTFILRNDVDLTDSDFEPVPYFAGTFDGGGHTVSGLTVDGDGSRQGFFRRTAEGALIESLKVRGSVTPGGSRCFIGGIVGYNCGVIRDCSFEGTVSGLEDTGGIAGYNAPTGLVAGCSVSGGITGEHRTGGIAGSSDGIVLNCSSGAGVDTIAITPEGKRSFDIASFSENDFYSITDIGGIVGCSAGTVQSCVSHGTVGYIYRGYNVGGIVGRSSGYISRCSSYGEVLGRKDVGGIVGQLEPYAAWEMSSDELDALRGQISYLNVLISGASGNADSSIQDIMAQLQLMDGYSKAAGDELSAVIEQTGANIDAVKAILDTVSRSPDDADLAQQVRDIAANMALPQVNTTAFIDSLSGIYNASRSLNDSVKSSVGTLGDDIKSILAQTSYIFSTLSSVINGVGGIEADVSEDISVAKAYEINEGAADDCRSFGDVRGESCVGGIAGAVGFEVSFDAEDTLDASEALLKNAKRFVFAAVRACSGYGDVSARGECAGGIVGKADAGTITDCISAGAVSSASSDYVGGIAGQSGGSINGCWSRALLSGGKYIGGIAGLGTDITDCRSYSFITESREYAGSIAGWTEGEVSGCLFVEGEPGAVDGVSYAGSAEPVSYEEMMAQKGLPETYREIKVTFRVGDRTVSTLNVPFGGSVDELPQVENDGERYWKWDDFDREHIYYSISVNGRYCLPITSLSTGEDIPRFLAEGVFYEGQYLTAVSYPAELQSIGADEESLIAASTVFVNDYSGRLTVRMRAEDTGGKLYVADSEGVLRSSAYRVDGSYIVFELDSGGSFAYVKSGRTGLILPAAAAAAVIAAAGTALAVRKKKKSKEKI